MSNYPNNYLRFEENCSAPKEVNVDNETYTLYDFKFKGLYDFYEFLKHKPQINKVVWADRDDISSLTNGFGFAGKPYDEAIENLIKDVDPGYQEYLKVQKTIQARYARSHNYKEIKTIAGGSLDPVSYTTGSPTIYKASRLVTRPKFITMDIQVAYNCGTDKDQVFNRAIIITNLIRALENHGYNVDINSFMVAENGEELIRALFEIKRHGGRTNYQTLYKSLVDVEFFRRLCFRIMEISDVKNRWWSHNYGRTCGEKFVRDLLRLEKEDIYFDQPSNMGIYGEDIGDDFASAIRHLKLDDIIDVNHEKEVLRKSVKVLRS